MAGRAESWIKNSPCAIQIKQYLSDFILNGCLTLVVESASSADAVKH